MASDASTERRFPRKQGTDSGFQWVTSSPSPAAVERLEAAFPDVVKIPEVELEAELLSWQQAAVIARSYHRWVPAEALIREFRRAGIQGAIVPVSLQFRCHVFRFDSQGACELVLNRPWVVNGQVIGIEAWRPEFFPAENSIPSALIWVRLPSLPLEFWKEEFLRVILAPAGCFLFADASTVAKNRGGYARACIRVDLSLPLRPGTRVQGIDRPFWQQFSYENLDGICHSCGSLHLGGQCKEATVSAEEGLASDNLEGIFGSWIAAVRQRRVEPGAQSSDRRKPGPKLSPVSPAPGVASSAEKGGLQVDSAASAEGWLVPAKLARRRSSKAAIVAGGSASSLVQGMGSEEAVPAEGQRAGFNSAQDLNLVQITESQVSDNSKNPFAILGSGLGGDGNLVIKDGSSGPLKRARQEIAPAPRSITKADKRKGKGKVSISIRSGVPDLSPGLLTVSPGCIMGNRSGELSLSAKSVAPSELPFPGDQSGGGSILKNSVQESRSAEQRLGEEGLQVCAMQCLEDASSVDGSCSDSVMLEDQGGVSIPPSI